MCRGVGRQIIFEDDRDREYLLGKIRTERTAFRATIYAWCLMDNHIHLLAQGDKASLGSFMRNVLSSYALFFNKRHERVGHVFQDRFLSIPVETDEYFLEAIRYIHQNPLDAGITDIRSYPWSSYHEYLGDADIAETEFALGMFESTEEFDLFNQTMNGDISLDLGGGARQSSLTRALFIAQEALGGKIKTLKSLPRSERDGCIELLLEKHLSIRQIEKITGIGRGIIAKVSAKMAR